MSNLKKINFLNSPLDNGRHMRLFFSQKPSQSIWVGGGLNLKIPEFVGIVGYFYD